MMRRHKSAYFFDLDADGAFEHFTLVSVSSQWQVFQSG